MRPIIYLILAILVVFNIFGCNSNLPVPLPPKEIVMPKKIEIRKPPPPVPSKVVTAPEVKPGDPIFIRIFKQERELEVWLKGKHTFKLYRSFPICYISGHLGPKLREGDRQAPEGFYRVFPKDLNSNSRYDLSFNIGYPNQYDRIHGRTGSAIMVHGGCVSAGCFAMTNHEIEEIYSLVQASFDNGQSYFMVDIFPFRMTPANLKRHRNSRWRRFWANLKEGYDSFEQYRIPPDVEVRRRRYVFSSIR